MTTDNPATSCPAKGRCILFGSVALNIFLVAFMLGRASFMPPPPPPPFAMGGHGMHGEMPPPPPPPMFGPAEMLSPEEMRANMEEVKPIFDKVRAIRDGFAQKLAAGPVSKEEALKQFAEVEQLMTQVREKTQDKIATKISTLSPEERSRLAERLQHPPRPPHGPDHGPDQGPGRDGPPPPPPGQ